MALKMFIRLVIFASFLLAGCLSLVAQKHIPADSIDLNTINQDNDSAFVKIPKTGIFNSSRGLEPGQAYYQNSMLFYNEIGLGLSHHFSLSASFIPTFESVFMLLNMKVSFPIADNISLSGGGLLTNISGLLDEENGRTVTYYYLSGGWHNENWNWNLAYFTNGFYHSPAESSFMVINGAYALNNHYSFATEAFINFNGLISFGTISFQIHKKRFDLQLGLVPLFANEFLASPPWFCFRYKFKAWK